MTYRHLPTRRLRILAAGAALALPFTATAAGPGNAATAEPVSLISGRLVDGQGAPLADADVLVRAERDAGGAEGGSIGTVIARGVTDSNGVRVTGRAGATGNLEP